MMKTFAPSYSFLFQSILLFYFLILQSPVTVYSQTQEIIQLEYSNVDDDEDAVEDDDE